MGAGRTWRGWAAGAAMLALWACGSLALAQGNVTDPAGPAAPLPAVELAPVPITIVDDRGTAVHFDAPPQRIVSLLPSLTESVCALGACGRLVGVDRYSRYPASVQELPVLGGGLDPGIEAVVGRRPDVVLISVASRASQRLEALGLKVIALEPHVHADVRRILQQLEDLLQVAALEGRRGLPAPTAEALWQQIEAGVQAAAEAVPPQAQGVRVYFEVSQGPYAAGPKSFIGETLARLGAVNVLPAELGPFPRITPEFVLRADPDVLMVSNRSMVADLQYPGWQNMRAMRAGQVCRFGPDESDVLVRPGPRLHEAAQLMAQCLAQHLSARPQARSPSPAPEAPSR